jgi:hypothetical protein
MDFSASVSGSTPKDIMDLVVLNQYFDTLQEVGSNPNMKIVLLPNDDAKLRSSLMEANAGY